MAVDSCGFQPPVVASSTTVHRAKRPTDTENGRKRSISVVSGGPLNESKNTVFTLSNIALHLWKVYTAFKGAVRDTCIETTWSILLLMGRPVLLFINHVLDWFGPWFQLDYHMKGRWPQVGGSYASDGVAPPGADVTAIIDGTRYGPDPYETMEFVLPAEGKTTMPASVLYVHGGGWIAANSSCLLHSITPLARLGFPCYSMNYPLAPVKGFPYPVVSVLRALAWMKKERNVENVCLLGDSAGGNLVTMAAAYITTPKLLKDLSQAVPEAEIENMTFPNVIAVSSAYGIMDQHAWKRYIPTTSTFENFLYTFCLEFAHRCYRSTKNVLNNKFTLHDVMEDVNDLPPLQLIVGDKDNLVYSNRLCNEMLLNKKIGCELRVYADARHAFVGFPPAWLGGDEWKRTSGPAVFEIAVFFKRNM